jgi:hypothetical protein
MAEGTPPDRYELLLFSTERDFVLEAVEAGVDGIIVDWELDGKLRRQAQADTEINHDTVDDLRRVRSWVDIPVTCRINPPGKQTERELEAAIDAGADEVFVPMVRSPDELARIIDMAGERCGVGALIETTAAVACTSELAKLPVSRFYVGLNDLAIERRSSSIFDAIADGTVERVRSAVPGPFGFAGLTAPEGGHPIPCRLLISELVRLNSTFSFLRRSYRRDARGQDQAALISRIRSALAAARNRTPAEVGRNSRELEEAIAAWSAERSTPLAHA